VVIRSGAQEWSAADLDRAGNAVALRLQASGVKRGDVVAVRLQRGPALVAALLGVLRAGAGYLPMDPDFPEDRLRYMLEDSGAAVLLTDEPGTLQAPPGVTMLDLRTIALGDSSDPGALARLPRASGSDLAYLLYTSGSTGKPKGVRVPQRAVVNFLESMRRAPGMGAGSRLAAVTTVSFDISVLELFLPLAAGGTVVLVAREQAIDGHALRALLEKEGISMMQATPATWRLLIEAGWRGGAGFRALCGGEALPEDLAEALFERVGELWNMYGPTETTVWSTCERILPGQGSIGIGRPIGNTQVWVLDDAGALQPIGVPGEICIGGEGVADGYHRRPELTAARFIPDRISGREGARLYRTGDLGRWTAEGRLQHLGRSDFQVKLRGYRIELGEIETVLLRDPRISQCVVVALGKAEQARLVAYLVPQAQASLDAATLRDSLRRELPDYMVPAQFVSLQRLPLTPNGKIDRAALPAPEAGGVAAPVDAAAQAGLTPTERQLVSLWSELLGVGGIRASDNFLDLGGHSLMIMRAVARVETLTGVRLSPRGFVFQTLAQIAAEIDSSATRPMEVLVEPAAEPAGLLQRMARLFSRPGR
jgi:amino acid adenylation domain-containing protein